MKSTRIIFFGTPEFAIPALGSLVRSGFNVAVVVTQPDKPVGRGLRVEPSPIKIKAQELGIPTLQPNTLRNDDATQMLRALQADLAVVVAYGKIIPTSVLDLFPRGVLNLHPSLLPKYRGPSPIQSAILNGDAKTGVTLMLLDAEMDHGPVLAARAYPITPNTRSSELSATLAHAGAELLINTMPGWLEGKLPPQEQDHRTATFTKLLEREDGRMNWNNSAEYRDRMVHAYDLWPGTWTLWGGERVKILRTTLLHATISCANNATPGYVWKTADGRLAVNCSPGSLILEQLQREGKKSASGSEFLRGYPKFIGNFLV